MKIAENSLEKISVCRGKYVILHLVIIKGARDDKEQSPKR